MKPCGLPLLLLLLAALLGAGCGYRLVGTGHAPGATFWIAPVDDETDEPLFGAHLRAALARETLNQPDTSLAGRESASAQLRVRALSIQETTVAYVAGDKPRQYQLVGEVEATLTSRGGNVVWKALRLKADRLFAAGDTLEETENKKNQALSLLAGDLAREILRRASLSLDTAPRPG